MRYDRRRRTTRTTRTTRNTRPTRTTRTTTRRPYRRAAPRRQGVLSGKPVNTSVYRPQQPQVQRGYLPFANSMRARLPWAYSTGFAAPGGSVSGTISYRLNSIFDPDPSGLPGSGGQPRQFDQISGLYGKYIVHGAKFTLEFSNPGADGLFVGYGLSYTGDSGGFGGYTLHDLTEQRNIRLKPIQNTGSQKVTFSLYVPIHALFGIPKMVYSADRANFGAAINANPLLMAFVTPIILDTTGGTTGCNLRIGVTYYTELTDPKWQAQS